MGHHFFIKREIVRGIESLSVLICSHSDAPAVQLVDRTIEFTEGRFHVEKRKDANIDEPIGISFAEGIVLVIRAGAYLGRLLGSNAIKGRRGLA
jgi:hypothetical protein